MKPGTRQSRGSLIPPCRGYSAAMRLTRLFANWSTLTSNSRAWQTSPRMSQAASSSAAALFPLAARRLFRFAIESEPAFLRASVTLFLEHAKPDAKTIAACLKLVEKHRHSLMRTDRSGRGGSPISKTSCLHTYGYSRSTSFGIDDPRIMTGFHYQQDRSERCELGRGDGESEQALRLADRRLSHCRDRTALWHKKRLRLRLRLPSGSLSAWLGFRRT